MSTDLATYQLALNEQITFSRQFWHDTEEPCKCAFTLNTLQKKETPSAETQSNVCRNA